MGDVIVFLHGRERRSAIRARRSKVTPDLFATGVRTMRHHHSEGIESRCGHLRAATTLAPISAASASGEPQTSTTSRKLKTMRLDIGQPVLKGKQILSGDFPRGIRQHVPMEQQQADRLANSKWRQEFSARVKQARGTRTQQDMAELLGITQTTYSKYEGSRASIMPPQLMPLFCKICGISLYWLLTGEIPQKKSKKPRRRRAA